MRIMIQVPGPPVPKGRPRVTRFGTYTPDRTREYETRVREAAIEAVRTVDWPTKAEYTLHIAVYRERRVGDAVNFAVAIQDALQGVCYDNDKRVKRLEVERFDEPGESRTLVDIRTVEAS